MEFYILVILVVLVYIAEEHLSYRLTYLLVNFGGVMMLVFVLYLWHVMDEESSGGIKTTCEYQLGYDYITASVSKLMEKEKVDGIPF